MADAAYRDLIDALVASCRHGQGQIGPSRVRAGLWNANASSVDDGGEQSRVNDLLSRMPLADREVLAGMLSEAFVSGVHESLVVLHEAGLEPFTDGVEGSPFADFAGRLAGWNWPEN